jgi:hypothetical protein
MNNQTYNKCSICEKKLINSKYPYCYGCFSNDKHQCQSCKKLCSDTYNSCFSCYKMTSKTIDKHECQTCKKLCNNKYPSCYNCFSTSKTKT